MGHDKRKNRLSILLERRAQAKLEAAAKKAAKKGTHGGRRKGAGRPKNYLKRSGLAPMDARTVLEHFDLVEVWSDLINCRSHDVRLKTLQYLYDRALGKTPEHVVSASASSISVEFVPVARARLDAEQNELLDRLTFKPTPPVLEAETVVPAPEPAPEPQREPRAPIMVVSGLECPKHGSYVVAGNSKSTMCPRCVEDGERDKARLFSLLPNRTGSA
jgi:hypothetical protein